MLHVAGDIKAAANEALEALETERERDHFVQEWMESIGEGVPGYVTPKVADRSDRRQRRRASCCSCSEPTRASGCTRPGWADVGYSPAEVAVKEVLEETGIECVPQRLLAVIDGQRMGFSRFGMYMLVFHCSRGRRRTAGPSAGNVGRRLVRRELAAGDHRGRGLVGADGVRRDQR